MRKIIPYIVLVVGLYLFLFNPPIMRFRELLAPANIIIIISLVYILNKTAFLRKHIEMFRKEYTLAVILFVYSVLRCLLEGHFDFAFKHFIGLMNIMIVIPCIIYYFRTHTEGDEKNMIRLILIVVAIAASISMYCLYNPAFNTYIKQRIIQYAEDSFLYENDWRGFGFSSFLTSQFGYILGFVFAAGLFYIKENKWFIFFMPFVLLAIMVNARTGLLIAIAGALCYVLQNKNNKTMSIVMTLVLILVYLSMDKLFDVVGVSDRTADWITGFEERVGSFFIDDGSSYGNESYFERMVIWPDTVGEWLFGRGFSLFRNTKGFISSDIGWIIQLNFGGIIYMLLMLYLFYCIFRRLLKCKGLSFTLFFIATFILINTKSTLYPSSSSFCLIMLLYFSIVYNNNAIIKKPLNIS